MFTSQLNFILALSFFAIGAIGSLFCFKKDSLANIVSTFFGILGSVFGLLSAISTFKDGGFSLNLPSSFPILNFSLNMDFLSAFFVLIISLVALLAIIYGFGYVKHYYTKYNLGSLGFFLNSFIIGMLLVAVAHNAILFLISWEIMSLASYFLVIYEKNESKNIQAGFLYFIMTHAGTAFITLAFLLLYRSTGSFDFGIIKDNVSLISPLVKNLVFLLAFVGFGTKAGIIPFHIWLPAAHPAAPSHVSALMSGVMIKTGIYMFIRLFVNMLPGGPMWWGIIILISGAISSVLGVLYALTEHDIKKLLAYHSIENIGIILLGLGGSLIFSSLGFQNLADLSLVAALFHTLNHAVFKALLFMGAGSVIQKTHTRNIEAYGGLIKLMPYTAFFFLIGSIAISALPPFNGFASEWMTFQALFAGIGSGNALAQWSFIVAAGSLALTGGLAAACFVKVFGITFLARPRSESAKKATESSFSLQFGMAVLAILTLVIGVLAAPISKLLLSVVRTFPGLNTFDAVLNNSSLHIIVRDGAATLSMPAILIILVGSIAISILFFEFMSRKQKEKIDLTWDCGTDLGPRMEITATGFSRSIVTIFGSILGSTKEIEIERHDINSEYSPKTKTVSLEIKNVYHDYLYNPTQNLITLLSGLAKKIQSGNVNAYIFYIFAVLIILLITGATK